MKYKKNINPYTQREAEGVCKIDDSIICWPTFNTSITPIKTANDVVLIIRVAKLIAAGTSLLTA